MNAFSIAIPELPGAEDWRIQFHVTGAFGQGGRELHPQRHAVAEQLEAFFLAAGERRDRFEALFVLAASAGLRPGELLALKWPDLTLPDDPRWSGRPRTPAT